MTYQSGRRWLITRTPSQTGHSQAGHSQAQPNQAIPSRAESSHAKARQATPLRSRGASFSAGGTGTVNRRGGVGGLITRRPSQGKTGECTWRSRGQLLWECSSRHQPPGRGQRADHPKARPGEAESGRVRPNPTRWGRSRPASSGPKRSLSCQP
jgi:hypothetical protein